MSLVYEFRKEQVMKELDENIVIECRSFNRACREIMTCMYGTNFVVYHFLRGENGFGEKEADRMIDEMMEFLPDNFTKAKKQFYKDYLFIALLLAYQQNEYEDLEITEDIEPEQIGDVISDVGLGKDTGFSSIINRALTEDSFLQAKYGTKLVTGSVSDLDGYLAKIYSLRKKNFDFKYSGIFHPMFAGVAQIIDILEGREYDKKLDKNLHEEYFSAIAATWPCKKRFIKSYYRFRDGYFKKGNRDDFQKNIEQIVKYYLISIGLSLFDDKHENSRKTARLAVENAGRKIYNLS